MSRTGRVPKWPGVGSLAASLLLAGVLAAGCQAQQPGGARSGQESAWIGTRYPPAPQDVRLERGTTLGEADTASFSIAEVESGDERYLWLTRRSGVSGGQPAWTVLDVLRLPSLADDRWVGLALCGRPASGRDFPLEPEDVETDPEIVAIVRLTEEAVLTGVESAWRADRAGGRFEPIATSGLACINEIEPQ